MADRRPLISAALDGEGPMPDDLDATEAAFLASATRLRSMVRVEEAAIPPDVTAAVLAEIRRSTPLARSTEAHRRPVWRTAAAVFAVAAIGTAIATRPGGPLAPAPALAAIGDEVLAAQHDVAALDARLVLVERHPHPELSERRYEGTLRYRAPEELWLHLEEVTTDASGFPANDLDLVVDEGTAWSTGLRACPVGTQPSCLGAPTSRVVTGLAPFAEDWLAPLDLVVPTGAFLPATAIDSGEASGTITIETTVARLERTVEGLRLAGALRAVHPTDGIRLELDTETATIRRLTVVAGDSPARAAWAAGNGYAEPPGTGVLDLTVTPGASIPPPPPTPVGSTTDAGFVDERSAGVVPSWLPDGYDEGRAGVQDDAEPAVAVRSWTDGRGWIRIDVARGRSSQQLLGGLGPIVQRVVVGAGTGYADPEGTVVAIHAGDLDVAVTGSVPLELLVRVAASLPVLGEALPAGWPQGQVLDTLPVGALRGPGPVVARYDGAELLLVLPGPGGTSTVLTQHPGSGLGPPGEVEATEVEVRGTTGRYDARAQRISWIEDGWVRELRGADLDLAQLLAVAAGLRPA